MPSDVRDALRRGAPLPDGGPDIESIVRGGKRRRARRRAAIVAASAAVVAVATFVAPDVYSRLATDERQPPANEDDQPAPPAPKSNGDIAFVRSVPIPGEPAADYNTTLYVTAPNGGDLDPLLEGVFFRGTPAWSPDGTRFAAEIGLDLRIVDVTTGENRSLNWCEDCSDPTWSPDGTRLIFSGRRESRDGLWSVQEDGSDLELLRAGDFEMQTPHWSPQGRTVAIVSSARGVDAPYDQILLLNVAGDDDPAAIEPILPGYREGFGIIVGLGWSPDGRSLVFAAHADGDVGGIYVADIESGEQRQVVACPGNCSDFYPTFSPDGEQIAFTRVSGIEFGSDGFIGDVMVMDAAGGEPRRLTGRQGLDCCPAWQPHPND
jgi:Tol biopolymer transport system component